MYEELVKQLRYCANGDPICDMTEVCPFYDQGDEEYGDYRCVERMMEKAADAIEKLQAYADLYKDGGETAMRMVEQYKARIEELQKQLQKSEADNVNLTGWLAEEHANNCPHYIRNVHDRGDDSLCDKYKCEVNALPKWIPVTEFPPEGETYGDTTFSVEVLGTEGFTYRKAYYNFKYNLWIDGNEEQEWPSITHWMPLPKPPKEEQK